MSELKHRPPTNNQIREKYRLLRMQNVPVKDARQHIAEECGVSLDYIDAVVNKKTVVSPNPGFQTYATSTLYKNTPDGQEVVLQWVKESRDKSLQAAQEIAEAMKEKLPRKVKPVPMKDVDYRKDVLAVYPMGDPHLGQYSYPAETGVAFDLEIAERNLCSAVARLVDTVPSCESALIVNVGDYIHSDNQDNRTTRGNHALDVDTRWSKVLRVAVKAMRQCIESALRKHKHVTVVNAIGNHDDHSSMFLTVALANVYENEPRVTINDAPTAIHFHEFGKNMIAITHGHSIKMDKVPIVAASEQPEMWGRTKHRWGITGHIHYDTLKEFNGMKVESFRTLAARDAWAASKGYLSGRDMKAILLHRDYGECERHIVSVEMLEND